VKMIELVRQFEMHTRMMLTARDLDASASSLIRLE
jgi:flagellar basal body rod protein FlgF